MSVYKVGTWYFIPRFKLSIFSLILFIILVYLGSWQLARADAKANLIRQMQRRVQQNPVPLAAFPRIDLADNRFMPVVFDGVFINKYTFLLDNQMLDHTPGYRVITIVQSPLLKKWVLVDRGWVQRAAVREHLPDVKDIYGVRYIKGLINTIATGIELKPEHVDTGANTGQVVWPKVIQVLDYTVIANTLQHSVYEFLVQLPADSGYSYPTPPIDFGISKDKNIAYAMQWFAFALLVVIYYLIACFKRTA